ncbi:hypothetical protein BD413DRAFT_641843 [Trametes elegans]|nr:hypothetical protein BD413DRAFT_641843 [Trametes elegans]
MSLVLPAPTFARRPMPSVRSSSIKVSVPGIVVFTDLPSGPRQCDALHAAQSSTSLSPAEIEDVPLSPIVFGENEEYEKNRLSFYALPPARAASSPSSPNDAELSSPVLFSQTNLSSPSLAQAPPSPVFPSVSPPSTSLEVRRKRPLPPLPNVVTHHGSSGGVHSMPRHELIPIARSGRASPCSGDDRESDSGTAFSLSPLSSPSLSSQSPATSTNTTASSEPPDSARAVEAFLPPRSDSKPKRLALTIPARSQSTPLPQADMAFASVSPCISVTPASPVPSQPFPAHSMRRKRTRTPSPTSIVTTFDLETGVKTTGTTHPSARAASPSPSLAPSTTSTKSGTRGGSPKSTLRRIASKTRLFGRRTLSSASDPWADEDEETVVGHGHGHGHGGSLSLDDAALRAGVRARSESPLGASECEYECASAGGAAAAFARTGAEHVPRAMRRVEIAEVTLTPHGDVWEARELEEVIPKLRQLRAPSRIRI